MVFERREVKNNRACVVPRPDMLETWPGNWGEGRWIREDALLELDAPRFDVEAVREAIQKSLHILGMYACFYAVDGAGTKTLIVLRGPTLKSPTAGSTNRVPVLDKNDSRYLVVEGHRVRLKRCFTRCTGALYTMPMRAPVDSEALANPRTTLRTMLLPRVVFAAPSDTAEVLGLILVGAEYEVFGDYIHSSCHSNEHLPWLLVRAVIHTSKGDSEAKLGGYILALDYSEDQKNMLRCVKYNVPPLRLVSQSSHSDPLEACKVEHETLLDLLNEQKLLPSSQFEQTTAMHAIAVDVITAYEESCGRMPVAVSVEVPNTCFEVKERRDGRLRVLPRCDAAAWPHDLWIPEGAVLEIDAPRYDVEAVREAIGLGLHKLGMYSCFYAIDDGGARTLIVLRGPTLKVHDQRVTQRIPVFNCPAQSDTEYKVLPLLERVEVKRRSFEWQLQSRCLLDGGAVQLSGAAYTVPMRAPVVEGSGPEGSLYGGRQYGIPRVLYAAPSHAAEMVGVVPMEQRFTVMGPVINAEERPAAARAEAPDMLWVRAYTDERCDLETAGHTTRLEGFTSLEEGAVSCGCRWLEAGFK
eukprot:TRINITY_DN1275_c0_g2_i1.p1 TRINITY_DN1275_c0_g2~~TRINITY_DN1275_c0_g2_i1.p1  ORF type:complete len:653 (+),score=157.89 TRINITY_DN1275_c0_g2_i1:217-1959(+)